MGIATSVEDNLIVPVIREAQKRSLGQIVTTLSDLTDRARNRRLTPSEMMGSTFTISNLGMFGIESFTAIIKPPETAILAIGSAREMAVVEGGQIKSGWRMKATISVDHRISDGAEAAQFMQALAGFIENPARLLI